MDEKPLYFIIMSTPHLRSHLVVDGLPQPAHPDVAWARLAQLRESQSINVKYYLVKAVRMETKVAVSEVEVYS